LLIEKRVQEIEGEKDRRKREEMRKKGHVARVHLFSCEFFFTIAMYHVLFEFQPLMEF
jgi:hypothetical protein